MISAGKREWLGFKLATLTTWEIKDGRKEI
jgi:hypothetical protein